MSNTKMCLCNRRYYRVEHRNHNHSYFESPKGQEHYSSYSGIRCLNCGWLFRSKAKWVDSCPDIDALELERVRLNDFDMNAPNVFLSDADVMTYDQQLSRR